MSRKSLEKAVFDMISLSMEYNGVTEFEIIEEIEKASYEDLMSYFLQ